MQVFQTGEIPHGFAFTENGALIHYKYAIVLAIPMANQPTWSGDGHITFGSDWADVRLRVAIHDGTNWGTPQTINVPAAGPRVGVGVGAKIPALAHKISIGRVKTGPNDTVDDAPASWLLQYQAL
ncbi:MULTISPECIES: hypothetical protein [unclassified Nonomuraea]|uniref:hypothetical protein n=1 Tax=unclassified Nonomuraea TaxID=2593643 RepID=UPI0033E564E8